MNLAAVGPRGTSSSGRLREGTLGSQTTKGFEGSFDLRLSWRKMAHLPDSRRSWGCEARY